MCTYNIIITIQYMSVFTIKQGFGKLLNYFFMFQCNEHIEINKGLCSLACTWMPTIDSQFHIIDSLSLEVSLE